MPIVLARRRPQLDRETDFRLAGDRRNRDALVAGFALLVLAIVAAAVVVFDRKDSGGSTAVAPPSPAATVSIPPELTWTEAPSGVVVPSSRHHGPRVTEGGRAAGYALSPQGAALAAVQVLVRSSPTTGPASFDAVLASQVTGPNVGALKLATSDQYEQLRLAHGLDEGEPLRDSRAAAHIVGYVMTKFSYGAGSAQVRVVLDSTDLAASGRMVTFDVSLVWYRDDWRVIAPPRGDWGSVATTVGSAPSGLLLYDDIGR